MIMRRAGGFTLFEIAVALLIMAAVVTTVFLAVTAGLKAQQRSRLELLASIKMMELSEAWANPPDNHLGVDLESGEMAESGTRIEHDLEPRLLNKWKVYQYGARTIRGWGDIGVVPPAIASRLESNDNEIAEILAGGGQLYHFRPSSEFETMSQPLQRTVATVSSDQEIESQTRRLVFAIRGLPQQNSIPNHPLLAWPYYEHYPFPLQPWHMRLWHWNVHRTAPVRTQSTAAGANMVTALTITQSGAGYHEPPVVTISPPPTGRTAVARAIVNRGQVTGLHILDPGFGYAAAPTISFTRRNGNSVAEGAGDPRVSMAAATATIGPVTIAMVDYRNPASAAWMRNAAYSVGNVVTSKGLEYRCTTAGTSANVLGGGPEGSGSQTSDGSVRWSFASARPGWQGRLPQTAAAGNTPDWTAADEAFRQLYAYQYHFRRSVSPATSANTWLAQLDRIQNPARTPNPDGWPHLSTESTRDSVDRMTASSFWSDSAANPPVSSSLRSLNYDRGDPLPQAYTPAQNADGEDIETGERARLRTYLTTAQRLARTLLCPNADPTRMRYVEWSVGNGSSESWPMPAAPGNLPSLPAPSSAGSGWSNADENAFPPPAKILALSYLLFSAHLTTTRMDPAGSTSNTFNPGSGWVTGISASGGAYTSQPDVIVNGGGGEGCRAQAVLDSAGSVTRVIVLDPGIGYTSVPTVTVLPAGATGTATIDTGPRWDAARQATEKTRLRDYYTALQAVCESWFIRYASSDPNNWGAPRPANRALAWDYPLLQYDMMPSGAMRPDAATLALLPNSVRSFSQQNGFDPPATQLNYGDIDLAQPQGLLGGATSLYSRSIGANIPATINRRLQDARSQPAWRSGRHNANQPYDTTDGWPVVATNIDRAWRIIGEREPLDWGPSSGLRYWNGGGRLMRHTLPPGNPTDYDNAPQLWYSWGDAANFNLCQPFHGAERSREVVFWAVDWMDYEDFETARDPDMDARSMANASAPYGWATNRADIAEDLGGTVFRANGDATAIPKPFYEFKTQQPVDRNNNGHPDSAGDRSYDTGTVKASVRMRATSIARFVYYDGRVIGGVRQ